MRRINANGQTLSILISGLGGAISGQLGAGIVINRLGAATQPLKAIKAFIDPARGA
jgi:hypothetical protein